MKQRGFTLIELMIVIAIICIVTTIVAGAIGAANSDSKVSIGINGMTESRCIEGYKFIVGPDANARQILDEFGKGVRCQMELKK